MFSSSGTVLSRTSNTFKTTGPEVGQVATQRWSNAAASVTGYNFTTLTPSTAMPVPGSWTTVATAHYDTTGRNDYTDDANSVRTTTGIDSWERPVSITHTKGATTLYSDVVTRDKTDRIVDRTVNGTDPRPSNPNYIYDNAGRLTDWWERDVNSAQNVSGTYRFTYTDVNYTNTCTSVPGANSAAGSNSNRTEETFTTPSGTVTSVYCYDYADRIGKVSKSSGTNPYTGGFVYDAHGNTTTVGAETFSYDGANRHLKTVSGSTTVEYTRDAADRIVTRKVNGTTVSKQAYTGTGDTADLVLDNTGAVKEITLGLLGGGLYTWRPSSAEVWSHGNTHGDLVLTTNNTGTIVGTIGSYDPFGNALGTTSIDNADGNLDYGWHGQAQRPLEHDAGLNPTIEMGARPYQASLGRFLAVDPIEGGTPNDYLYVNDPVNQSDLDGRACRNKGGKRCKTVTKRSSSSAPGPFTRRVRNDNFQGCWLVCFDAYATDSRTSILMFDWWAGDDFISVQVTVRQVRSVYCMKGVGYGPFHHGTCRTDDDYRVSDWSFTGGNGSFKYFINGKPSNCSQLKRATNLPSLAGSGPAFENSAGWAGRPCT